MTLPPCLSLAVPVRLSGSLLDLDLDFEFGSDFDFDFEVEGTPELYTPSPTTRNGLSSISRISFSPYLLSLPSSIVLFELRSLSASLNHKAQPCQQYYQKSPVTHSSELNHPSEQMPPINNSALLSNSRHFMKKTSTSYDGAAQYLSILA